MSYSTDLEGGKEKMAVSLRDSEHFNPENPALKDIVIFPKYDIHTFSLFLSFKLLTIKPQGNIAPLALQVRFSFLTSIFYCYEESHKYLINTF